MTQTKKTSGASSTAKLASNNATATANKAARTAYSAVESGRANAENVVKITSGAMKDMFANSTVQMGEVQEKLQDMGRESMETFTKTADMMSRGLYEMVGMTRENIEACVECGNVTTAMAKNIGEEMTDCLNRSFSDSMEMTKAAFSCRTLNDVMELQNRVFKYTLDNFFNESSKLSGMFFEYAQEACEPLNQRMADASEQMSKVLAA